MGQIEHALRTEGEAGAIVERSLLFRIVLSIILGVRPLRIAALGQHLLRNGCYIRSKLLRESGLQQRVRVVDDALKAFERGECALRQQAPADGLADGVPGAGAGFERETLQGVQRGAADAAHRRVDDALQPNRIMRILHQLEIAQQVLDLGALVEREAADHRVLDAVAAQRLFHQPRLRIRAIEHSDAGRLIAFAGLAQIFLDVVGDEQRLVFTVGRLVVADLGATLPLRP